MLDPYALLQALTCEKEYRCNNGVIECRGQNPKWFRSAHDEATVDELPGYERIGHPVVPALREKFGHPVVPALREKFGLA